MDSEDSLQTIVPFTPYEWKYVRQLFRSRIISEVKECVIILATWISRTGDNTPVAISCSHVLLQAIYAELLSEGMCESERYMAINDLRSKHGYAIVRFVNYVNEMGQTGAQLRNMVHACGVFGIPKKIVDIRHAITHQSCPDIAELRAATNFCLDWLWQNFWLSDARVAMNSEKATTSAKKSDNFAEFASQNAGREQQYVASVRAFNSWRGKNRQLSTELEWSEVPELFAAKQHILLDAAGFLRCLLRDGHLIQTAAQWKNGKFGGTSSDENWELPEAIQSFWEPLLHVLFNLKLYDEVVVALLWRLREPNIAELSRNQCTAYVRMILKTFADANLIPDDGWLRVLDHLLPVAKNFSQEFIDFVMRHCKNLSRKRRNQIHQILNISKPSTNPDDLVASPSSTVVRTVDDIQKLLKKKMVASPSPATSSENKKQSAIEYCDPEDWSDIPFGMTPGQRVETFTLVIEKSENCRKRKAFDTAIILDDED